MCAIVSVLSVLSAPPVPPLSLSFVLSSVLRIAARVDEEGDPLAPRAQGRVQAECGQGLPRRRGGEVTASF